MSLIYTPYLCNKNVVTEVFRHHNVNVAACLDTPRTGLHDRSATETGGLVLPSKSGLRIHRASSHADFVLFLLQNGIASPRKAFPNTCTERICLVKFVPVCWVRAPAYLQRFEYTWYYIPSVGVFSRFDITNFTILSNAHRFNSLLTLL